MLFASRHIYGKSHIDMIVETFLDIPGTNVSQIFWVEDEK
jgi:hypothetical protein